MTTDFGKTELAAKSPTQTGRSPAGYSVPFAPLALASVAVTLLGLHLDVLGPLAVAPGITLPAWVVSTVVLAAMWAAAVVRSGYRVSIPTPSITGAVFVVGLFIWTAILALVSSGPTSGGPASGISATMQVIAGLTLFMIVASLVAQMKDLGRLNHMTFQLGVVVAGAVLLAALFGLRVVATLDAIGVGSSMLPGLLAISLFAGLAAGNGQSPFRLTGLSALVIAITLSVTPASLAVIALALLLVLAARLAAGSRSKISKPLPHIGVGVLLASLLVVGLTLFNGAFDAFQGQAISVWAFVGAESRLADVTSGGGWISGAVPLVLWAAFVMYVGVKALTLLSVDRHSVLWTFGLVLAVLAALALSATYQPLIWLTSAVVVGRSSRMRRLSAFRARLDA